MLTPVEQASLLAYSQLRNIEEADERTEEINALLSPYRK
jgi:hypothetical protein